MIFVTLNRASGFLKGNLKEVVPITLNIAHIESVENLPEEGFSQLTTTSGEKIRMDWKRETIMAEIETAVERNDFSKMIPILHAISDASNNITLALSQR